MFQKIDQRAGEDSCNGPGKKRNKKYRNCKFKQRGAIAAMKDLSGVVTVTVTCYAKAGPDLGWM